MRLLIFLIAFPLATLFAIPIASNAFAQAPQAESRGTSPEPSQPVGLEGYTDLSLDRDVEVRSLGILGLFASTYVLLAEKLRMLPDRLLQVHLTSDEVRTHSK